MSSLSSILIGVGAPILADLVKEKIGGVVGHAAGRVIDVLANELGVQASEEALVEVYHENPVTFKEKAQEAQEANQKLWHELARASDQYRLELLRVEDSREHWLSWAWRPAMSWTIIFLWLWSGVLVPLAAALGSTVQPMQFDHIIAFTSVWLTIYGGGHTVKHIFQSKA